MIQQQLISIAAERSPEKRLELLHKITDLYFARAGEHTDVEVFLFNDIMDKIVETFSRDLKLKVSANLAILPDFPGNVVRRLAADEDIEIARPVLRNAPSLTDDDLVLLAQGGSQAHLTAIADRATLAEKITDVLIDRGNRGVVHAVTANHGARFSERGMDQILLKCEVDVDLRELLVERPDLSPKVIDKLLPLVSASLLIKLAERGYEVRGAIPADMVAQLRQRFAAALRTRKEDIRQISVVIEEVRQGNTRLDDAARQFAELGRLLDVATLIATFARIERDHAFNLIYKGQLQTVLILCRALGLSWPTVDVILAVRATKLRARYGTSSAVRRDYEAIDAAVALRTIRFLRVRQVASQSSLAGEDPQAGVA